MNGPLPVAVQVCVLFVPPGAAKGKGIGCGIVHTYVQYDILHACINFSCLTSIVVDKKVLSGSFNAVNLWGATFLYLKCIYLIDYWSHPQFIILHKTGTYTDRASQVVLWYVVSLPNFFRYLKGVPFAAFQEILPWKSRFQNVNDRSQLAECTAFVH